MEMDEFVGILKAIAECREVLIPAQIFYQISDIIPALGGPVAAYECFKKVSEAEAPRHPDEEVNG
jgi:hypothetical protein